MEATHGTSAVTVLETPSLTIRRVIANHLQMSFVMSVDQNKPKETANNSFFLLLHTVADSC
jgi:hypothetical protein